MREIHLRVTPELHKQISYKAARSGKTLAGWLRDTILEKLGKNPQSDFAGDLEKAEFDSIVKDIQKIYQTLKTGTWRDYPEEFQRYTRNDFARLEEIIYSRNLGELKKFYDSKPWLELSK